MQDHSHTPRMIRNDVYKTSEEILKAVQAVLPLVRDEAAEVDRIGHLTPALQTALTKAGVYRIAWPAEWGGPEMRFEDQVRLVEMLAYEDASVAWNVQILSDTGFYGAQLPREVAEGIYASMDEATAGGFFPPARADKVEGGWHIAKGRWPFGSGIHSAQRIVCGIGLYENGQPILDDNGQPEFRVAYLPAEKVELINNWDVLGLRGSGSTDYAIKDVIIPEAHVFKYFDGAAPHLPPLSRYGQFISISLRGVVLGLGRRILDDVREELKKRGTADRLVRQQYAEAEMNYRAARAYSYAAATYFSDRLFAGEMLSEEEQADSALSSVNAGLQVKRACDLALELLGASTIYKRSPFERRRRDLETLLGHLGHQRKNLENSGARLLGLTDLKRQA